MSKHQHIDLINERGERVNAIAPVIVSASRATDIPAFYAQQFFDSLDRGYTIWTNPYNGKPSYVSFANTRFIVFWSKNPRPFLSFIPRLAHKGIGFYVQFTLNDYVAEGLEPNLPDLAERIDTFKRIVDTYGIDHAIWRFDPLILTDRIGIDELLAKIHNIGLLLKGYTEKLIFSFADIAGYRKVGANLTKAGINYKEWQEAQMLEFARKLSAMNEAELHLQLSSCAETIDLAPFGIGHNHCIDPELIGRLSPDDTALQMWLFGASKDQGQRQGCGCILSKDIGTYNSCPHGCLYCYANTSPQSAVQNYKTFKSQI